MATARAFSKLAEISCRRSESQKRLDDLIATACTKLRRFLRQTATRSPFFACLEEHGYNLQPIDIVNKFHMSILENYCFNNRFLLLILNFCLMKKLTRFFLILSMKKD